MHITMDISGMLVCIVCGISYVSVVKKHMIEKNIDDFVCIDGQNDTYISKDHRPQTYERLYIVTFVCPSHQSDLF